MFLYTKDSLLIKLEGYTKGDHYTISKIIAEILL